MASIGQFALGGDCTTQSSRRLLISAYLAVAVVLAVPMIGINVPTGIDLLNHFARIHVLAHLDNDPDLSKFFEIRQTLVPYAGMDYVLTPFARVLPTLLVGRLFILFLIWGLVAATAVVQRVFTGRIGLAPAGVGLIAYNGLLAWGFANYLLGVIFVLLAFAAWHGLRDRSALLRLALFTIVATVLYLTHILALGLYAAMAGSYELFSARRSAHAKLKNWGIFVAQFVPAALLWAHFQSTPAPMIIRGVITPPVIYNLFNKALTFLSPFRFSGASGGMGDIGDLVFLICGLLIVRGTRRGHLIWQNPLTSVALTLALCGILLPTWLWGVFGIDMRFPVPALCIAMVAFRVAPTVPQRHITATVLIIGILMVLRVGFVTYDNRQCDAQYSEFRSALQELPRGALLWPVIEIDAPDPARSCSLLPVYRHMAQLVTIDRSGYAPDFFSWATSIAVRRGYLSDDPQMSAQEFSAAGRGRPGYIAWFNLGNRSRPVPAGLTLIHRGSFFDIWKGS